MDAEEARLDLEIAAHQVRKLHAVVQRAVDDWVRAKDAHKDNTRYRQYRTRHGEDFVEKFRADLDHVKKECAEAEKQLDKAKAAYKAVTGRDPYQ